MTANRSRAAVVVLVSAALTVSLSILINGCSRPADEGAKPALEPLEPSGLESGDGTPPQPGQGKQPDLSAGMQTGGIATAAGDPAGNIVTYAGGKASQRFLCVVELSDGSVLIGGGADDLAWVPSTARRIELGGASPEGAASGAVAFILRLSPDMRTIRHVYTLPQGAAADIRFIKTTNLPGKKTGEVFVSGTLGSEAKQGKGTGYFIARLDGNFVDRLPAGLSWCRTVESRGLAGRQPWDVGGDGKVVYASGEPHGWDWMAVYRTDDEGNNEVVPHWRIHWYTDAEGKMGEFQGTPASKAPGRPDHSGIVLKIWGRGDFRSWNKEDFLLKTPDGNGGFKQGKWPFDAMFDGYFDPTSKKTIAVTGTGRGYYGYRWSGKPCANVGAIAVDRRTGAIYIGGNNQSRLPDGNPDFEPWLVAMDAEGRLRWWQRLYSEEKGVSTPDQYVDAVAIDYTKPAGAGGSLLVVGRAHGNNVNNFWGGKDVKHPDNPGYAFQNGFTGTHGNMHFSWIGRLTLADGTLLACTYLAEFAEGAKTSGQPFDDPLVGHWPRFDSGWPDLNTTRVTPGSLRVDGAGNVYVAALGRRVVTTSNAYMQMPDLLANKHKQGHWSHFVRVYAPDLTRLKYSSILSGRWDWYTGEGHSPVNLAGICPTRGGVFIAGFAPVDGKIGKATGNEMPTKNVPPWGRTDRTDETAVAGKLHFRQ